MDSVWIKWNLLALLVIAVIHSDAAEQNSSSTSTTSTSSHRSSTTISSTSATTTITSWEEPPAATNSSPSSTNVLQTSTPTTIKTSKEAEKNVSTTSTLTTTATSTTTTTAQKVCKTPNITNGEVHTDNPSFIPGTSVSFTCNGGYKLRDNFTLTCSATGKWNRSVPECTRIVCKPPQITHGEIHTDNPLYVLGTSVSFTCIDGYTLSNVQTLTCSATELWNGSAPECTQIECPPLEQIANGKITTSQHYLPNHEIEFQCDEGFRHPDRNKGYICSSNGTWTGDLPVCDMIRCGKPTDIDNGIYLPVQDDDYKYNTHVTYACSPGYEPVGDMTIVCLSSGNWSANRTECSLKAISYNDTCISETDNPCTTNNAACLSTEGNKSRCLCTSDKFYLSSRDSCLSKIPHNSICNETWPPDQCETEDAHCLKDPDTPKCICKDTFFYFEAETKCVKKINYNMTIFNLQIHDKQTTETSATVTWTSDHGDYPSYKYLLLIVVNENGTEVERVKAYYTTAPDGNHTELKNLSPGHHYTAVITVYDLKDVPSLTDITLKFCTRPLPVIGITFENVDLTSLTVTWDYDSSSFFTEVTISVASHVQIVPATFVDCPNQQPNKHVCIMDRKDIVKQLRMQNLTPGTFYTFSIYTGGCDPRLHSNVSLSSTYTVPSRPKFYIKDTAVSITSSSIVVAWNDTADISKQFKLWYAIVKDKQGKIVQNQTFENTVQEGTVSDLESATKYTVEFYTTVLDRQSNTSDPVVFYTRPSDVKSADVTAVHENNLTVTVTDSDLLKRTGIHFKVLITTKEIINKWNITKDPWSVVVTSLSAATNYSIAVYAVLFKDDGSALHSSGVFRTWTYTGPPAPTKVDILSINTNSLTIKPSTNISVLATITYDVLYAAVPTTSHVWVNKSNVSGDIKLEKLLAGTQFTIRVYTRLTQTSQPITITSDGFFESLTYTRPPSVDPASISVNTSTSDSLKIQWKIPTEGDTENYHYQASFTCVSPNGDRNTTLRETNKTTENTAAARGLDPGTKCEVDLQVFVGRQSSNISHTVLKQKTKERAPGKVREVSTYDVSPTEISIRWKDPSERNGVIRGYEVKIPKYKQTTCEPGNPWSDGDVECFRKVAFTCEGCPLSGDQATSLIPDGGVKFCNDEHYETYNNGKAEFNYTVSGLHPYMNYSIQVVAYTFEYGLNDSHTVRTAQIPPGVPTSITGNPDNSSTITVQWEKPLCGQRNGPLGAYQLSYTYRNNTVCTDHQGPVNKITILVPGIQQLYWPLTGLSADWEYNISVQASNDKGNGVIGTADPVTTLEALPDHVRDVKIDGKITSSSVPISWTQPCLPRGVIANYTINVKNTDQADNVSTYYTGTATSINATGLLPYRNYTIVIWASTAIGQGAPSAPIERRTGVGVPRAPINVAGDATGYNQVEVHWDATFFTGPTSFIAFVSSNTSQHCIGAGYHVRQCTITGLTPYTNYTFIVKAVTEAGNSSSTKSEVVLTEESVPGSVTMVTVKPESDVTKKRSVVVAWGPPAVLNRHGRIIGYAINIKHATNSEINISCSINSTDGSNSICSLKMGIECSQVDGATPGELNSLTCFITNITTGNYTIQVLAQTIKGKGPSILKATYVEPGAPLSLARAEGQPPLVQHGSVGVDDPKHQIAVQFPRDVICNEDNGKPTSWGLVVAEDTMATETPFTGSKNKFLQAAKTRYRTWFDVEGSDHMAPYIATVDNWNPCVLPKGSRKRRSTDGEPVPFVVGASGKCSGVPQSSRCNGELTPDKNYRVKAFVCTDGGCTETNYSPPISTDKLVPIAMIAGIVSAAIVTIIAVVITLIMKRRQMLCFRKTVDEEVSTHRSEPPVSGSEMKDISSKSSRFKPGPVKLADFPDFVDKLYKDSHLLFSDSYTMLKEEARIHPMTAAESQKNRPKNRYTNILAYDHSRVKLLPVDDDEDSDYINANYIPGYTSKREYIACQGPLVATFNDFWRMVWEQNVDTIVMLTKLVEKGRHKCDKYWPELNEPVYFGDLVVSVQSESHLSDYTIRVMEVKLKNSRRVVRQFCYLKWPDMGCPDQPSMLLDFVKSVKEYTKAGTKVETGPVIVHCSAGVGRTGTFIAVDYLLQYIKDHDDIDIYRLVLDMRNHRCNMVQTEDQFVYIHECMKEFITLGDEDDEEDEEPIYVNDPAGGENVYENTAFTADM